MAIHIITPEIHEIIKQSISLIDVLTKLNERPSTYNYKCLKEALQKYCIDTSHFIRKRNPVPKIAGNIHDQLIVRETNYSSDRLKKRLIEENLLQERCYIDKCPIQSPIWLDEYLSFHLDHINGNHFDNRLENLRLLCPNCHSQTSTYCGKNNKKEPVIFLCECGN
ncbi:MAG: hypothetical protein AABY22_00970, partial [Nanoarchaeota archaeon]